MRQLGWGMAPAFVLALALSASAQEKPVTTKKDMTDTVKVTVSGDLVLDYVWRSAELTEVHPLLGNTESTNRFEGYTAVRFNVELSDKVSAVVELGTRRVNDGNIIPWVGATGGAPGTPGTTDALEIQLREAHVNIGDFLTSGLNAQFGITTWSFDIRGNGSAFVFDPRHSETFVHGAVAPFGLYDELQPVGGVFTYTREQLQVDVVLLPAVLEGGPASDDEVLYAADLLYKLDNAGSRVGVIVAVVSLPDESGNQIFTVGGGATLRNLVPNLELYGEIYFQFGDLDRDTDAGGFAFQVGGEYTLDPNGIKIGANLTFISGDDDAADDDSEDFLSYENVNDLLILESMYYGLDWDTNYFAVKFHGSLPLDVKAKGDLVISVILGITRTAEDIDFGGGVEEDGLGNEIDVKARWSLTKQAALHAAVGFLLGSDILEESLAGSENEDDSAMLFVFGADLRF